MEYKLELVLVSDRRGRAKSFLPGAKWLRPADRHPGGRGHARRQVTPRIGLLGGLRDRHHRRAARLGQGLTWSSRYRGHVTTGAARGAGQQVRGT